MRLNTLPLSTLHTMTPRSLKTALALGVGLAAFGFGPSAFAQDAPAPAAPPGPVQQPAAPPGTALPSPTQPSAVPAPPGTSSGESPEAPAPETPPTNYNVQYNGLIDGYYLFNFRNPKNVSYGGGELYYDTRHNSPALSLAELNVFKTAKPSGFGFKATLMTGDTADINHGDVNGASRGLGESRYKNVQQLYGTYALGGDGAGIDFGKFYTPFGYEVTESNANYNYSRSTAYNILPFYHAGARIYTPVPKLNGLTATFYLVNGVYNTPTLGVQNDSKRPGFIGQLNFTDPKGKFTIISELGLGKQKLGSTVDVGGTDTKIILNDNNFTYNINANQLIGLDYEYAKNTPNGGPKTTINGYAVYYRQALTPKTAFALRFSGYDQKTDGYTSYTTTPGVDGGGDVTTPTFNGTSHAKPYDITATYEIKAAANFLTRFEYRHDHVNYDGGNNPAVVSGFAGGNSQFDKSDQDTASVSGVFTF